MTNSQDKIKIGSHVNRDMQYISNIYYIPYRKRIEIIQEQLSPEDISRIRDRVKESQDNMNIPFEVFISHQSDNELNSSYRITSNKYGLNIVPWVFVQQEEINKKATILTFETVDYERLLLLGVGKSILGACYAFKGDFLLTDSYITKPSDSSVAYTVHENKLYILLSEEGHDIVYTFEDNKYLDFDSIVQMLKESKNFNIQ